MSSLLLFVFVLTLLNVLMYSKCSGKNIKDSNFYLNDPWEKVRDMKAAWNMMTI